MKILGIIMIVLVALLALLALLYFALLAKLRRLNTKIYSYKEEKNLKKENVLIIYQPSRHKTIQNIVELVKNEIDSKNYGYTIHTLSTKKDNYNNYKYVIFVVPVYFGDVHKEWTNIMSDVNKDLIIIYNGLNEASNKEDEVAQKLVKKYSMIKLHTKDIENVKEFIQKEVL